MQYIIDGYNLMFRASFKDFTSQRQHIIEELNEIIQTVRIDAIVVFDAQYQFGIGSRSHYQFLTVCFTNEGETADDYIIDEVRSSKTPRQLIVVTSDKNLAWRARQLNSQTQTIEEFTNILNAQYKNKLKDKPKKKILPKLELPAPSPIVQPDEEAFNYYLTEFEKRFLEAAEKNPKLKEPIISDSLRWLNIFEKRSKDLDENQKDV